VQTRRDQLHAYRFQNRRALAALVTGEPNVLEPPMRRLTVITVSGIMIAILVAAGFALVGVFKPTTGDKWKDAGAIIVERETGARYVYLQDVLHPVLNYSSAVLAVGTKQDPHVVLVDRSDLKSARRGPTIGIDGIPDSLPSASSLVSSPWSVCSREQPGQATKLEAQVSVLAGDDAGSHAVPAGTGVLVHDVTTNARYLLVRGQRLLMSTDAVARSLGLISTSDVPVGTAFLDGVPAGPPLRAPDVPQAGATAAPVGGHPTVVGQLLHTSDTDQYFLRLADGVSELDPLQTALLRTLPLGVNGEPTETVETTASAVLSVPPSQRDWPTVAAQLKGLPNQIPTVSGAPSQNGGICAVYRGSSVEPGFATPPSKLPAYSPNGVAESEGSRRGVADEVLLSPGRAAVVKSRDGSTTVFVIADPGRRFAVSSDDVLKGFGYADVKPTLLPVEILPLIPIGPALDTSAALRPVSG
jgi:type VII secretion protein EccB